VDALITSGKHCPTIIRPGDEQAAVSVDLLEAETGTTISLSSSKDEDRILRCVA